MSIIADKTTRVIVQGITGHQGAFHTKLMLEYGTKIVAGVTPGKGGCTVDGVPVFDTVKQAKEATGANASAILVPPQFAADAILEAVDADLDFTVCLTEGIPILDMAMVKNHLSGVRTRLIGPNCPGIIVPDECKIGFMPGPIHKRGHVGVISRSGTLTYEAVDQLSKRRIGQSTAIGIGGDPITGLSFVDVLKLFHEDDDTYAVVMIGEIGGSREEEAARFIAKHMHKPVIAFIAGRTAPKGRRMGHAGAIISGGQGGAEEKIQTIQSYGIAVAPTPAHIGDTLVDAIKKAGIYDACLV